MPSKKEPSDHEFLVTSYKAYIKEINQASASLERSRKKLEMEPLKTFIIEYRKKSGPVEILMLPAKYRKCFFSRRNYTANE